MIPFVDLHTQYLSIKGEIDHAIQECIEDSNFIKGRAVEEFEKAFAEYIGTKYCLGVGNGTDALEIIMKALKIGPGDEVIVPALSWISTAEAVNNIGAEPVFVDIRFDTYTIDSSKIEEKLTSKTRAIIPVHLYGCPAEMNEISAIAKKYDLHIIEDCAQAHGAEYFNQKTGTLGIASIFSFFPSKNLGAFGDGGAIVTNNSGLYEEVVKISNHGQFKTRHEHSITGRNSRLDSLQASVLTVKLKHLDKWNIQRNKIAEYYTRSLSEKTDIILPAIVPGTKHVFHLYVVRSSRRKELIKILDQNQISWAIHYPNPLPFLDAYKYKKHHLTEFPVSQSVTGDVISLPMYPELTEYQLNSITEKIIRNY